MTTADPRLRLTQPDELPAPIVDDLSATVLSEAIDALAALRTPYWLGDSAVHLHALASLIAQAQRLLPDAVAQARDQDLTWHEIGQLLGLSGPTVARRYRGATLASPEETGPMPHTRILPVFPAAPAAPNTRCTAADVKADRRSPEGPGLDIGEDQRTLTKAGTTPAINPDHRHNAEIR